MKSIRKYNLKVGTPERVFKYAIAGESVPSNAVEINQLHIEFNIEKSDNSAKDLNTAEIRIYNLSDSTRALLEQDDAVAILEAGWEDDTFGLIFQGDIVDYIHEKNGADWVTTLTCADGYIGVREAISNKTYPAGSTVKQVLTDLFQGLSGTQYYNPTSNRLTNPPTGLGLSIGELKGEGLNEKFENSYSVSKPTKQAINDICLAHDLKWSIQDGKAYVNSVKGDPNSKYTVPLISEETGMIGSPTKIKDSSSKRKNAKIPVKGYTVKCTLNHEILPEIFVKIVADSVDVIAKIKKVKHSGGYESGDWDTEFEAIIQETT